MSRNRFWQYLASAIAIALIVPTVANAHTGAGDTSGFWQGITHPIGGLDHILAMVAVGLWAVQLGGKAMWLVPGTFVVAMALGSVIGHFGIVLPGVEAGIIASDFILGVFLIFAMRMPLAIGSAIVACLAVFHGYAHGTEMPETASGLAYGLGFILATSLLHLTGLGLGLASNRYHPSWRDLLLRLGGGVVVVGAAYILVNR